MLKTLEAWNSFPSSSGSLPAARPVDAAFLRALIWHGGFLLFCALFYRISGKLALWSLRELSFTIHLGLT